MYPGSIPGGASTSSVWTPAPSSPVHDVEHYVTSSDNRRALERYEVALQRARTSGGDLRMLGIDLGGLPPEAISDEDLARRHASLRMQALTWGRVSSDHLIDVVMILQEMTTRLRALVEAEG